MGDDIEIRAIEIIYDGLIQIDFYNNTKNEGYRCFVDPSVLLGMLSQAMQKNYKAWMEEFVKSHAEDTRED